MGVSAVRPSLGSAVVVPLVAVALAGCLGGGSPGVGLPSSDAALPDGLALHLPDNATLEDLLSLPEEVRGAAGAMLYTGYQSIEPTIGVTSDGALFMSSTDRQLEPTVVRSQDQGRSWWDVGPRVKNPLTNVDPRLPPVTGDPYVYVDPGTDRVFSLDLYAACAVLSWSDDRGESWETNPLACGLAGPQDHQTFGAAKPRATATSGYANLLYYCAQRLVDSACATSADGGRTWGAFVSAYVLAPAPCGAAIHSHVAAAPDGTVFLPRQGCDGPVVHRSADDGRTWTRHLVNGTLGALNHEVRVAADRAGNVYATWVARDGLPYYAASLDGGVSWGPARSLAPRANAAGDVRVTGADFVSIVAGEAGRLAVSYVGTDFPDPYNVSQSHTTKGWGAHRNWSAFLAVVPEALGEAPLTLTVRLNPADDPLVRGSCGGGRCPGNYDFLGMALDAEGRPWAAFVDVCHGRCATAEARGNEGGWRGFVGTLEAGPSLLGGPLEPLWTTRLAATG